MKTDTTTKTPDHKIEVKNVKHEFTQDERNQIGGDLARSIGEMRGIEGEFDQVKASFKARITEKESRIDALSTNLVNGFDYRNERCVVLFNRQEGKKYYYLEECWHNETHFACAGRENDPGRLSRLNCSKPKRSSSIVACWTSSRLPVKTGAS